MLKNVPLANVSACEMCGCELDTRDAGIFQHVSGWVENRRQGGANAVALPVRTHRFACALCIDRLRHGIPIGQRGLWDDQH